MSTSKQTVISGYTPTHFLVFLVTLKQHSDIAVLEVGLSLYGASIWKEREKKRVTARKLNVEKKIPGPKKKKEEK